MCQPKPVYTYKDDHRIPKWNSQKKSKWLVSVVEEEAIFNVGYDAKWFHGNDVWSLKYLGGDLCVIGEDHRYFHKEKGKIYKLIVAKFVVDQNCWHGYPVNTLTDPPDSTLFTIWAQTPGIPKKKIMKLNTVK